ncbi:hypothetical protein AgCh_024995 [Apium graveolens]
MIDITDEEVKVAIFCMHPDKALGPDATQSAFFPGRFISDNVMISFEVMHYLKRKKFGKDGFMALKLDMSKAYDIIEWKFLKEVLLKMGFSNWWKHLVLQGVQSVEYNIVHGEYEIGAIKPSRGLRQGGDRGSNQSDTAVEYI